MATAIGQRGAEIFEAKQDQSQWDQLRDKIWDWIDTKLGYSKVRDLTMHQFVTLAATEIVTGDEFINTFEMAATAARDMDNSVIPIDLREVPVGSTRDYSRPNPPVKEFDTHGQWKAGPMIKEVEAALPDIENGGWIGWTTGVYGDAVPAHKFNAKTNARIEAKVNGMRKYLDGKGYLLKQDRVNPGFHSIVKKPLEFSEAAPDTGAKNKAKALKKLLNGKLVYKTDSPYKKSKIDAATREIINATRRDFARRGDQMTPAQIDNLITKLEALIKSGRATQVARNKASKEVSDKVKDKTAGFIKETSGVDIDLTPAKQRQLANEKRGFFAELKKGRIGSALEHALSPDSNNDFYGMLYSLMPKGKGRADAKSFLKETLTDPLEDANFNYAEGKRAFVGNWNKLLTDSGVSRAELNKDSGLDIDGVGLSNSQVVKIYNYIKDPSLYKQLKDGGVDMVKVLDYLDTKPNLKNLGDAIPSLYTGVRDNINGKLDQHGYKTVSNPDIIPFKDAIAKKGVDVAAVEADYAILNRAYNGQIPATAPYTPFTAQGADTTLDVSKVFEGDGDYFSVMSGNLKRRTGGGALDIFGKNLETDIENYMAGPLRTASFLDFAKGASDVFSSKNLKAMDAAYGKEWGHSMRESIKAIVTGKNTPLNQTDSMKWITNWTNNTVAGIMFLNTRSSVLQLISTANFWAENPSLYAKGATSGKRGQARKLIKDSAWYQERGAGKALLEYDEIFGQEKQTRLGRGTQWVLQKGYKLTQFGDKRAIAWGGVNYVAGLLDQGYTPEEAIKSFVAQAEETQQSSRPERVGREQRSTLGRMILAFANTPYAV